MSKRLKAHDEIGCQVGDQVQIVESRPLSRDKSWVVEMVVKREIRTADAGVEAVAAADVDAATLTGVEKQPEVAVESEAGEPS
jgi:hypothetical protein